MGSEFIKIWCLGPVSKGAIWVRCVFEPYKYSYRVRNTYHEECRTSTMLEF